MKKVLIIGGSHRDIPLINACKQLGFYVITLGNRSYYIGHKFADKYYEEDFSDLNNIEKVALKERINYIIPGCSELAYINSVIVTSRMGLNIFDKPENLEPLFDKWKLKDLCKKLGIPTPSSYRLDLKREFNDIDLRYPVIVKPVDQSGGRGISIAKSINEIRGAIKKLVTNKGYAIVEEYIEGRLIAYSCVLYAGKIIFDFIAEDTSFINPFNVSTSYPLWDEQLRLRLRRYIYKLVKYLDLQWGVIHAQFIEKENMPYLIDITRRIPGDLFPFLIELSTGFPYSLATVMSYIKMGILSDGELTKRNVVRHCVFSKRNGILLHVVVPDEFKQRLIYRLDILNEGDEITNYLIDRVSIMLFEFENIDKDLVNMIKEKIEVVVK